MLKYQGRLETGFSDSQVYNYKHQLFFERMRSSIEGYSFLLYKFQVIYSYKGKEIRPKI